ncbi:MAG: DUF3883 domain-containing protein [Lachnospiraceae bacterium]
MADIFSILPEPLENQEVFILDHGKTVDGVLKYKDDLTSYGWNIRQFNKMHVGAFVLHRRPGKLNRDRKFTIYAGGVISSITEPDEEGNVTATISNVFAIVPPIKQGDSLLESLVWDSKKKKPGTWEHFWNQYGMNTISFTDFVNLTKKANCVLDNTPLIIKETDLTEEEVQELQIENVAGFKVEFEENGTIHKKKGKKYTGVAKKPDYAKIQKAKNKIGVLGEEIVMDILTREAQNFGRKVPVHAAKEEGDGLGYDIRAWDQAGNEIHVEVKTSKDNYADGFEMSYNEIEASKDDKYTYLIYRVYGLNMKTRECKIKIYEGPVTDDNFKTVPTKVAVYQK